MQGSLSKRLLFSVVRSQLPTMVVPMIGSTSFGIQSSETNISLTHVSTRNFAEGVHFEKVNSYESLISRISNAGSINDLLNVMNQNILLYKNEHLVLTLRVIARLSRSTPQEELHKLATDERFKKLTQKA